MELYENKAEDLSEVRYKYSIAIKKYLSEITERDIQRMKQLKFAKSHSGHPKTKLNIENKTNYESFLDNSSLEQNQCDDFRNEVSKLKGSLRRMKPEE